MGLQAIIAVLIGAMSVMLEKLVWRILAMVGVGVATYTGVDLTLGAIKADVFSKIGALPADVIQGLGIMKVDVCINMVFSAWLAVVAIKGASGAVSRWKLSK